jgi:hypothetical protein
MAHASVGLKVLGNPSLISTLPMDVRPGRKYPRAERDPNSEWANGYWRTGLPYATNSWDWRMYLAEQQFHYKASDTRAQLKVRAKRCARGHLSYDEHNIKKLRALVQGREMSTHLERNAREVNKTNKKQLVKIIEAADDADDALEAAREFLKFSELPPERLHLLLQLTGQGSTTICPTTALQSIQSATTGVDWVVL